MAAELLAAEADVSLSFTTDQAKGEWVFVRFTRSSLDAVMNLVYTPPTDTPVEVALPVPLPANGRVFVPAGYTIYFNFASYVSGSVLVEIINPVGLPTVPAASWPNANMVTETAKVAAAITSIDAVVTDLEGDVAGNSVAQAITDLDAVITALGA